MTLFRRLKASTLALLATSGLISGPTLIAASVAATEVITAPSVPAIAEERTNLDTLIKLRDIGLDPEGGVFRNDHLSGLEIRYIRILASRTTYPTRKRILNYRQPFLHFGDKQASRMLARLRLERDSMGRRAA